MPSWIFLLSLICIVFCLGSIYWFKRARAYSSSESVALAYDSWTKDALLEKLWGEHIHLGFYKLGERKPDFRKAKVDFVHELVKWSGLNLLPRGSRILDVGCGIGGSSRILAEEYGFEVVGVTISPAQVDRARNLTGDEVTCRFEVMDALNLSFQNGSFDGIWSVEAGPHMPDKQRYADEMLRVLRPGGVLVVADWNRRDPLACKTTIFEKFILRQLLNQWAHPEFSSINGFKKNMLSSPYSAGQVEVDDWTQFTLPSWNDSIIEGFRRPSSILSLGIQSIFKGIREIPTILMMRWAFSKGLMQFGVFKTRG